MSCWTSILGIIKICGDRDKMPLLPEKAPRGSEGGLTVSMWINPENYNDEHCFSSLTHVLSIFGSLRDYGEEKKDLDELIEYFDQIAKNSNGDAFGYVAGGVVTISSFIKEVVMDYDSEAEKWVIKA